MNELKKQERTPELIATEIRIIKERAAQTLAQAAFEIGRRLCEAKELVSAGNWLEYLETQLDYKSSTAENLMRIYREFGDEQVDLLTGRSPAEVFGKLNQSQMVAMFSLTPPERTELMDEHPELPEMSAREVQKLVAEKKAAEEERDRERKQRETAERLATQQADRAEKEKTKAKKAKEKAEKFKQSVDDLEKELERVREERNRLEEQQSLEKPDTSKKDARIAELEAQIKEMKEQPIEATYVPEEVKRQLREEIQGEIDAANQRADAAEQKAVNLQNPDAQAINYSFKEIQAKFADARIHLEKFREINPEKTSALAGAIAQTLHNMAGVIERYK